jgi:hypothetical protein
VAIKTLATATISNIQYIAPDPGKVTNFHSLDKTPEKGETYFRAMTDLSVSVFQEFFRQYVEKSIGQRQRVLFWSLYMA